MNINQALDRLKGGGPELTAIAEIIEAYIEQLHETRLVYIKVIDSFMAQRDSAQIENSELRAEIERMGRLITLASVYIEDLEEHEGAEGFSTSTRELSVQYYDALNNEDKE